MSLDGSGNLGETPGELDILAGISRPASRQSLKAVNTVRVADEGGADNAAQYGIAGHVRRPAMVEWLLALPANYEELKKTPRRPSCWMIAVPASTPE